MEARQADTRGDVFIGRVFVFIVGLTAMGMLGGCGGGADRAGPGDTAAVRSQLRQTIRDDISVGPDVAPSVSRKPVRNPVIDPPPVAPLPPDPTPLVRGSPVGPEELLGMVQVTTWRGTCSGVVIAYDTVLTAAHCVCTENDVGDNECRPAVSVTFRRDPDTGQVDTIGGQATWRPDYDPSWINAEYHNDLAVVKLDRPGPAHARPFALADTNLPSGSQALIAGFGHTGDDCSGSAGTLNSYVVPIDEYDDSSQIMTFFDQVTCPGDSGGAVLDLSGHTVHGIHSMQAWTLWHGTVDRSMATAPYLDWISSFLPPPVPNEVCRTAPPILPRRRALVTVAAFPATMPNDLTAPWNSGGTVAVAHLPSSGASFLPYAQWLTQGAWADSTKWSAGDFDGDGRADLAAVFEDGGRNSVAVRLSTGISFSLATWASRQSWFSERSQVLPGDFDGDGRDDLALLVENDGLTSVSVFHSNGTGFDPLREWWAESSNGSGDAIRWTVGDFNGDRRADLASIWNDGGSNTMTVWTSTGTTFTVADWAIQQGGWMDSTRWLAGDFDGDSKTDLAAASAYGDQTAVAVYLSSGSAFPGSSQWEMDGGWMDSARWAAGDFDNDGKTDLAAIWNDGGKDTITVRQSTGSTFTPAQWATGVGGWMDSTQWCAGRFRRPEPLLLAQ